MPYKKSEITKELLYQSSLALMEEKGFRGATIRDICKRANVSVGTFYCYFQNKNDIIREIYLAGDSFFLTTVVPELEGLSCVAQLRLFVRRYAALNTETGLDIVRVLYNPDNECFREERPMQIILKGVIEQGQKSGAFSQKWPPGQVVDHVFDTLRGICYHWCLAEARYDLAQRMDAAVDFILHGLQNG